MDVPNASVENQLARKTEIVEGTLPTARLPDSSVAFHGVADRPAFGPVLSQRFLAVNVLAGGCSGHCGNGMPVVGKSEGDGVNIRS